MRLYTCERMGLHLFDNFMWICCAMYYIVLEIHTLDPCIDYIEFNDTSLTTTNIPSDLSSITCPTFQRFKWYRYTGTDDGLLTNQCPTGLQCGSHTQIWINDSFPTVDEDVRLTKVCIHKDNTCCANTNMLRMKNCTLFLVYFFVPIPLSCANYCFFEEEPPILVNVNQGNDASYVGTNKWIIPVAIITPLVIIGIMTLIVVLYIKNNKYRKTHSEVDLNVYINRERVGDVGRKKFNAFALH